MKSPGMSVMILVPGLFSLLAIMDRKTCSVEAAAINCGDDSAAAEALAVAATEGTIATKSAPPREIEKSSAHRETATFAKPSTDTAPSEAEAATTNPAHSTSPATTTSASSDVKQFLQTVQCTLERAKPWVEEIEKEAKRLEESAKRFGEGVINKFSDFMEKLIPGVEGASHTGSTIANTNQNNHNNNNSNNNKKQSSNPVQSLLNTILDGFGAVVSVVGGGVAGVATGLKPRPAYVVPAKEPGAMSEVVNEKAGDGDRFPGNDDISIATADTDADVAAAAAAAAAASPVVNTTSPARDAAAVAAATIEHANELENQIVDAADSEQICPFGFVVDVRGMCQRVEY